MNTTAAELFAPATEAAPSDKGRVVQSLRDTAPTVTRRGADDRVEEWVEQLVFEDGTREEIVHEITTLATGLHYFEQGEWKESSPDFHPVPGGFLASRGRHQVAINERLRVAGAVTVVTPEGQLWRSTPLSLALRDRASGLVRVLGQSRDCRAEQVSPYTVLFRDAFEDVAADLQVVNSLDGVACDVVLREPLDEAVLAGFATETSELVVLTEVFEQPQLGLQSFAREIGASGPARLDDLVRLGGMVMEVGTAFGQSSAGRRAEAEAQVFKRVYQEAGRLFLEEALPVQRLQALQRSLEGAGFHGPAREREIQAVQRIPSGKIPVRNSAALALASLPPRGASGRFAASAPGLLAGPIRQPANPALGPGVVIDWALTLNGGSYNGYTFSGATTYYVSGPVTLSGNVIFESGTVLKFAPNANAGLTLASGANINWQAEPYLPVIMTGRDDDTVGDKVQTSTGTLNGTYAATALTINGSGRTSPLVLANLHVRHAARAIWGYYFTTGTAPLVLRHHQVVNCTDAWTFHYGTGSGAYRVQNALVTGTGTVWRDFYYAHTLAENVTIRSATHLRQSQYSPDNTTLTLRNCLLAGVANPGTYSGDHNESSASTGMFKSVLSGDNYLADYGFKNTGTTAVDAGLLADLRQMTTDAPIERTGHFTTDTLLSVTAWRDEDTPDVGYHYWPLDYVWSDRTVTAQVTCTNGVVIGVHGASGTRLGAGGVLVGEGRPQTLNRFCWLSAVQEKAANGTSASDRRLFTQISSAVPPPQLRLRFTAAAAQADTSARRKLIEFSQSSDRVALVDLRDCQFTRVGANFTPGPTGSPVSITAQNNLWRACNLSVARYHDTHLTAVLRYNLHVGGSLSLTYYAFAQNPTWTLRGNFFDAASLSMNFAPSVLFDVGSNGYTTGTATFGGTGNVLNVATGDPVTGWQTGPLGRYYYPDSGSTGLRVLVNFAGQTASAAGLYHHATTPNQTKEGVSTADIGFHYVATSGSANSVPLDTDGDGLADYDEDRNGNGVRDTTPPAEFDGALADTDGNGVKDRTQWEMSKNITVNDPAQDDPANLGPGTDGLADDRRSQNSQFETASIAYDNTVIVAWVDTNRSYTGYGDEDSNCRSYCLPEDGEDCVVAWSTKPPRPPEAIGWAVSRDAGRTFTDMGAPPLLPVTPGIQVKDRGNAAGNAGDPVLARHDASGRIYLIGTPDRLPTVKNANGNSVYYLPVWVSTDQGNSFGTPVNIAASVSAPSDAAFYDKPYLVVDNHPGTGNGHVYAIADRRGLGSVLGADVFRSTDLGQSWVWLGNGVNVSLVDFEKGILAVGPNHQVFIAGWVRTSSVSGISIRASENFGGSFAERSFFQMGLQLKHFLPRSPGASGDEFEAVVIPSFICHPLAHSVPGEVSKDHEVLYMAYHANESATSGVPGTQCYVRHSTDSGHTWSAPVSPVNAVTAYDRWNPSVVFDQAGTRVFCSWYDRRGNGTDIQLVSRTATLANRSASPVWGSEAIVSTASFPPVFCGTTRTQAHEYDKHYPPLLATCPQFEGRYRGFIGEYDITSSSQQRVYCIWSDARGQLPNSPGDPVRPQRDIRVSPITW